MKLSIAKDDGQCVQVAVSGRVTQSDLGPIHEPLGELLGPNAYQRQVRLDLSDTPYVDSSGVGWLLACHKRMKAAGGKLTLHAPHPTVANLLRVLRLDKVLDIEPAGGSASPTKGGAA
jgi:anti-sigma B factor antagonist